jgi:hypothetical protein
MRAMSQREEIGGREPIPLARYDVVTRGAKLS